MPLRHDAALLGDLALEPGGGGAVGRERRVRLANPGARRAQLTTGVVRQNRDQARRVVAVGETEQRRDTPPVGDGLNHRVAKPIRRFERHGAPGHGAPIAQTQLLEPAHGATPPRALAA